MVTENHVDLNLTISPSSRKIPALRTKNSAQPCQIESYGEIIGTRVRPTDDDDDDIVNILAHVNPFQFHFSICPAMNASITLAVTFPQFYCSFPFPRCLLSRMY